MNIVTPFIANTKSTKFVKPRQCAFGYPATFSLTTTMLCTTFTNHRDNRMRPQLTAVRFGVITAVTLKDIRSSEEPTYLASNRRNRIHQCQNLLHVVPIHLRDTDRKGNPLSFHNDVAFRTIFPAVRTVFGPVFIPPTPPSQRNYPPLSRKINLVGSS